MVAMFGFAPMKRPERLKNKIIMKHEIRIQTLADLDRAAGEFLSLIGDSRLIAFYAPIGA